MEDVLALYHDPYDEARLVTCLTNPVRHFVDMNAIRSRLSREQSLVSIAVTNATENSDSTSPPNH